jgi:hypothetical protein
MTGQRRQRIRQIRAEINVVSWAFLLLAIVLAVAGWVLQNKAFPKSSSSPFAQVSATVYTTSSKARVLLQSTIQPNASQQDTLDITVKEPEGVNTPWVLVVTCPHSVRGQVPLELQGVAGQQPMEVLASVYDVGHKTVPIGCFPHAASKLVVAGQDISLSLPVLEQSPLAQSSAASTPLYVVRSTSANQRIEKLVEVLQAPGSSCPAPGSTYATPSGSSASCFTNLPAGAAATQYKIPQSVTTSEILTNVSLSGDRIDSMFPPGQITSNDEIIWQGTSGLSPSLSATNLSSAESSSKAGFLAGLLYGLAAGLFIPFLQDVSQAVKATRKPREPSPGGSGGQGMAEPAVAGPSRS